MYKVLIVDDEPIVKIALRSIIAWEDYGYTICSTASDGQEALLQIEQHSPNLIITDLKMPNMDGLTLIQTLKEQHYSGEILVLSNYEDFDFVRSALVMGAVDYILKVSIQDDTLIQYLTRISEKLNSNKLTQTINEQYEQSQEKQILMQFHQELKEYLDGGNNSSQMLLDHFSFLPEIERKDYAVCYFNFQYCIPENPSHFAGNTIQSAIKEAFENISGYDMLLMSPNCILVLLPMNSLEERNLSLATLSKQLPAIFQLYMSISPVIIYQEHICDLEHLKQWYHTFQNILELRFYSELSLIHASEFQPIHYMNFIYYKEFAKVLQENGCTNLGKSIDETTYILEQCSKFHICPEIVKTFFEKTLELVEYYNRNISLPIHEYLIEIKTSVRRCKTAKELQEYFVQALNSIFLPYFLSNSEKTPYKPETLRALEYINRNYCKKINLTSIAEEVNLSASYLCRLFKSEVTISLTNYINQLRMDKAGELIRICNPTSSIKEVAISVGIDDQLYFSRMFKKYYGITPSEYRQRENMTI